MNAQTPRQIERLSTGIPGLDTILRGGLPQGRMYLVEGDPGTGKTTLALQFMLSNIGRGANGLYVTLSESRNELQQVADSHGWNVDTVPILELTSEELASDAQAQYTVFHPSEVELVSTLKRVLDEVERINPTCIVFDSVSELRLLAGESMRYRRQLLALKGFFSQRSTTVLVLDDRTGEGTDKQLQSIAHGVIRLQKLDREYGATRRNLEVLKVRGSAYREGLHDYVIREEGMVVYPRVLAAEQAAAPPVRRLTSSVAALDTLIGGGLTAGTSNLLMGPAGVGKSTLSALYAFAAAARGERAAIFAFDELPSTLIRRCTALGMPLQSEIDRGMLNVEQVDPAEMSPGEFASNILTAVDADPSLRVIVIDSLNGFIHAMSGERETVLHLHELLSCLNTRGVTTILTLAQHGLIGPMETQVDISYLADAIIVLRYFERAGHVRQAISVLKNRSSEHEHTIREFGFHGGKIVVGEPLNQFQGVLTGSPVLLGHQSPHPGNTEA
ncbi:MAG: AAA family ATPase [Acidobacteriota bacterium]|nr:AAA family ATPase [Acidobacteriota bacterium]